MTQSWMTIYLLPSHSLTNFGFQWTNLLLFTSDWASSESNSRRSNIPLNTPDPNSSEFEGQ